MLAARMDGLCLLIIAQEEDDLLKVRLLLIVSLSSADFSVMCESLRGEAGTSRWVSILTEGLGIWSLDLGSYYFMLTVCFGKREFEVFLLKMVANGLMSCFPTLFSLFRLII